MTMSSLEMKLYYGPKEIKKLVRKGIVKIDKKWLLSQIMMKIK